MNASMADVVSSDGVSATPSCDSARTMSSCWPSSHNACQNFSIALPANLHVTSAPESVWKPGREAAFLTPSAL